MEGKTNTAHAEGITGLYLTTFKLKSVEGAGGCVRVVSSILSSEGTGRLLQGQAQSEQESLSPS